MDPKGYNAQSMLSKKKDTFSSFAILSLIFKFFCTYSASV